MSISSESKPGDDKLDQEEYNDEFLSSLNCDFIKISEGPDGNVNGDEFPLVSRRLNKQKVFEYIHERF